MDLTRQSVWEKELSDVFTLVEYSAISDEPYCLIIGGNQATDEGAKTLAIYFQDWGVDRETITNIQCWAVFQAVLEVGIVEEMAGFTFNDALKWAIG
ncbi:hypothetical protein [Chamaesiphon sp. OTE_8_metabat_110]|uniref:hypothetical protein n=1 Tax=Chamaesiphon sp. OTE_8_metabat_110 TaxID=2964696 RepID=UPI00286A2278|nr:hypothetical protein [Chamaesiphon sp. OTE_8_metabat_110]